MTKTEYKKLIDVFIADNYKYLHTCAENILKRRRHFSFDLVSELILFLYGNQNKLEDYIDIKMLQAFCVSWMKLQCKYKTTPFSRKYLEPEYNETQTPIADVIEVDVEFGEEDYVKDLRVNYTDNQIKKILDIHQIYPTLSPVNKILFDAYFIEGLSYDKIKDKYTFFRTKNGKKIYYKSKKSIYNLMKDLKDEIKNKLKENGN